ncbi:TetR/AcrR family transcriptional regulator [Formosa sp. S-31]|uniref:TetR/AcrR family transcriptional regulator n=1 Tax=Formosa sp. S-31 TaxID=2790949 RepID=UPI003EBE197B
MKDKIIEKSTELFSNLGFKSVTMDDIAQEMGISKKTIYQYFETKTKLVEATAKFKFQCVNQSLDAICVLDKNPIDEIFKMKEFVTDFLSTEKSSSQFQLKKYYPLIYDNLMQKQFNAMQHMVTENLSRGIKSGLYRDNIDIDFISRLHFSSMGIFKDNDMFPPQLFSYKYLLDNYIDYHLRGICTPKGIDYLNTKHIN